MARALLDNHIFIELSLNNLSITVNKTLLLIQNILRLLVFNLSEK